MTAAVPVETLGTFQVPVFDIRMDDAAAGRRLRWDVVDLTYSDDVEALDSFEFTLNDWDPVAQGPLYSSPWDDAGALRSYPVAGGDLPIPELAPGTPLSLYLSYQDHRAEPVLMLRGRVVSLATSFPASGAPVARVRVLNPLAWSEKVTLTGNATGGALDVMAAIAGQLGLGFDDAGVPAGIRAAEKGQSEPVTALSGLNPVEHLRRLARGLGLILRLEPGPSGDTVTLTAPGTVLGLTWGRTLLSFAPTVSDRSLVARVVVRGQNPRGGSEAEQRVEAVATWSDLEGLDQTALGPGSLDRIIAGLSSAEEVIARPTRAQHLSPRQAALNRMRELAQDLMRGSGQTLGLPALRAGSLIDLAGLGLRYSGRWEVTGTTHSIGAGGYTTGFQARKVVFRA